MEQGERFRRLKRNTIWNRNILTRGRTFPFHGSSICCPFLYSRTLPVSSRDKEMGILNRLNPPSKCRRIVTRMRRNTARFLFRFLCSSLTGSGETPGQPKQTSCSCHHARLRSHAPCSLPAVDAPSPIRTPDHFCRLLPR